MKLCKFCNKSYQPTSNDKSCGPCKENRISISCKQCGEKFRRHSINSVELFCSQSCSSRNRLLDPIFRSKFYTDERSKKIQKTRAKIYKNHPDLYLDMRQKMDAGFKKFRNSLTQEQKDKINSDISARHKRSGHKPKIRGGNGTGPTKAESILLSAFPKAICNYPVKTKMRNGSGYPTCYKVDLGFPKIKLAIEADGPSHGIISRKNQDIKKTNFLNGIGWTVLRFNNQRIFKDVEKVIWEIKCEVKRLNEQL